MRSCVHVVAALLLCVAAPQLAAAAPSKAKIAKARKIFRKASLNYKLGKFQRALAGYEKAYAMAPRPSALFNIANCYRHLGKLKKAIFTYKLFVDEWTTKHPSRQVPQLEAARNHVKALQRKLDAREKRATGTVTPTGTKPTGTKPTGTKPTGTKPTGTKPTGTRPAGTQPTGKLALIPTPPKDPAPPATTSAPVYKRWWFWTLIGVAVAGGATAVAIAASSEPDPRKPVGHTIDWGTLQ